MQRLWQYLRVKDKYHGNHIHGSQYVMLYFGVVQEKLYQYASVYIHGHCGNQPRECPSTSDTVLQIMGKCIIGTNY